MTASLQISRRERILHITLNRPEKRNALSFGLCRGLLDAFAEGARDTGIAVVLLDANGPSFCAGMDLDEVLAPDASQYTTVHEELFTIGSRFPKPIVAAVHGAALGGGAGLVANAHIVVAAEEAQFGLTEIRLALWPFVVFRSVANAMGERRALELSLTGRLFGAAEAGQWGLVHYVVPAEKVREKAWEVAGLLASYSPSAVGRGLAFVHQTRGLTREEAGLRASAAREEAFQSADFAEGVRAFRLRRKPRWD
jgi:enoyl-CoA hydratase/carnithine racemase